MIDIIENDINYLHLYITDNNTSLILEQTADGYKITVCTGEEQTEQIQLDNNMMIR